MTSLGQAAFLRLINLYRGHKKPASKAGFDNAGSAYFSTNARSIR